jgi:tripartite ATP-independent transporter DctP family solute receptor
MIRNLKKRGVSRREALALGGSAAAILAAPHIIRPAHAADFLFRIAHSEAIGSPMTEAFEAWTNTLNEESNGAIEAQHFPAGQLGSYTQLIEMSRLGTTEATAGGPDTEEAVAPEIAATGGAPGFIYKDEAHVDAVLQGPIGERVSEIAREKTGVEFVAYGEVGFRHLLANRAVSDMDGLSGLKIRVPELKVWIDFWNALGANPTPLPYAEQYNALSTGVIDGLEGDFFSIRGFKWHEQANNLTLTNHWFLPKAIRVNAAWLDALPEDLQELVRSTAKEAFAAQRAANRANTSNALDDLKAEGVSVLELDAAEKAKWISAAEPLFEEFGSKSAATAEMIAAIRDLG